uniref:CAP_C domain-containing protein n=1 Tax=Panagrellus redivivus TaxID=6233 RepID=A0A7E4VGC1_PANRE
MSLSGLPPSFSETSDNTNPSRLDDIFNDSYEPQPDTTNFFFNPSADKPVPQPRRKSTAVPGITLTDVPILIASRSEEFANCHLCIGNDETLRFEDASTRQTVLSFEIAEIHMVVRDNLLVVVHKNGNEYRFQTSIDASTKLAAVLSAKQPVVVWVFADGDGEDVVVEGSTVLASLTCYSYAGKEIVASPQNSEKERKIKLTPEAVKNAVWRELVGKKRGAKFVVGSEGTGFAFEVKRFKHKGSKKKDGESVSSTDTPPLQGTVTTQQEVLPSLLTEIGIQPPPLPSKPPVSLHPELLLRDSDPRKDAINEPIETTVIPEVVETTPEPPISTVSSLEKRITDLESRLAQIESSSPPPPTPTATNTVEFAMELYANIAASTSLTPEAKETVKKIISGTLHL